MTKGIDWFIVFVVGTLLAGLGILLAVAFTVDTSKEPEITVHCEGEYRVFMRGEQIEVLYDPDCLKVAKA